MSSLTDRSCEGSMKLHRVLWALLLSGGVMISMVEARADISFTVVNPNRVAVAGGSETFLGTITNNTDAVLPASDLFLDLSGFDPSHLTIDNVLGTVNFSINKGDTSPPVELFRAHLAADIKPGSYPIDLLLQSQDGDIAGPLTATLRVIPEASSWAIMSFGLLVLLSIGAVRSAARPKQKPAPRLREGISNTKRR
jgi:hypothetical protein